MSAAPTTLLRFPLDPVAEYLAATAWAKECGNDEARWGELIAKVRQRGEGAVGFLTALRLVWQAYGTDFDWPKILNWPEREEPVVHYAQEIVLRASGGEYVVLREENGRKRLKACEKDIRQAQRFLILDFKNPSSRPDWPLEFGNQIVLQPIDDNRFVSACEDLPPNFPLCVWGSLAQNWERFTLKRPDSDEARASDKTVRFRYTARFQCHSGKWVWTNYYHTDKALDGNLTTEPDTYENFTLEEPSH
jgi:hypothetical protein